ncbi:hypothetical protein C8R46DRAFT_1294476 [Mycena filopes]|nr:hypothetical protein C8R46DRAFT_1294476 [Mycena filopes]
MTYSNGATSVHYRIHFLYLFRGMAQRCRETGVTVTDDLFANVVDFSDAQRNGYIDAFIDFWLEFSPHGRDEKELAQAAAALVKGCRQHFDNQITRVAKISRIVGPERQSVFRKYAKKLLRQTDMAGLRDCASAFIADFPGAKPWVNWWMRPSHASMLFPVASDMEQELWDSLPETTNAGECMHHRAYQMVGRDNSLFYGLAGLVRIGETFERIYDAARNGIKVFYGSDPQYWKRTRFRYGYTKHSRHEARHKVSMDGRAPDTIARLKRNGLRKHPLRGVKPKPQMPEPTAEFQRSFRWKNNSCWLDSSLTVLAIAASHNFPQLQGVVEGLPVRHVLRNWLAIMAAHTEQAVFPGFDEGGCKILTDLRERFRQKLSTSKFTGSVGSSDALFGWLWEILMKLSLAKRAPDEANERCLSFFRPYVLQVKKCPGCEAAPLEHWEVSHPRWRAPFQLSSEMHKIFGGDLGKWFNWVLNPLEWETASCWRQKDSDPFCNGKARAKEYILSIPAILVLEVGDSLGSSWTVPSTLLPLGQKFSVKGVRYTLSAEVYTNYTVRLGGGAHFIARYVTPDGAKIFDYDGMEHAGHARHRTGASVSGWMSGPSSKLRNMPTGYRLAAVIYYLDGGADAQQVFCAERRKAAPWGLQVNPESGQLFARLAQLVGPNLTQMTDDQRKEWTTTARRRQVLEYQVDRRPRRKPLAQDSVTATERFIHELIPVEDSDDGVIQPTEHVDNDSIENLILETIHPSLPAQTGHQRRESTGSTDSTTPCPIQCFGCRGISGGDDGPDQVQCSACGFWSHFGCQPENGDVDWHDPKTEYICQRCRPRPMPELFFRAEIVMLPDPRSKEDWRNDAVLWYPAEFRKHHPHTTLPKNEFEFRFLECIQWPMSDDDHMRPLRSYKLDRATCEEILKVELRLEQMGLVRAAGIHRSQQPEDHPLIPIFDAVLAPLAQLLVEFPDGHPVVDSYKLFFTADAKEKQNLKSWRSSQLLLSLVAESAAVAR